MDNRLFFAILLVTLCWFSMSTNAQATNSTTSTNTTSTNGTSSNTTTTPSASNTTSSNSSSSANTTTTTTTTPSASNTTSSNSSSTTVDPTANTTMTNTTTPSSSTAVSTTASSTNPTSSTGSLTPNITVEVLQTNLSREGCGSSKLCAAEPSTCNPTSSNCFFFSAQRQGTTGNNFNIALSGQSTGYVSATLSTDGTLGGNDTTYVCANNNSAVQFIPALLDNSALTSIPESASAVNSVQGKVIGNTIQCTFAATVPSSSTRSTNLLLNIASGSYDASTGALGNPVSKLTSSGLDLTNPSANVTNELNNSTGNAFIFRQSFTQVLLVSAGMMGLAWL